MKKSTTRIGPRIARRARSLFQHFAKRQEPDAQAAEQQDLARSRRYWDEAVAVTLTDLVRQAQSKASGRVQLITLAEFRTAVGAELWITYQDKILLIAETTIARMMGKGQVFIPINKNPEQPADQWLLLLPDLEETEAVAHADAIAKRIGEKLMGAQFTAEEPPLPTAAILDLTGAVGTSGSINLNVVRAAVAKARQAQIAAKLKPVKTAPTPQTRTETITFLRPAWSAATEIVDTFFLRPVGGTGEELAIDPGLRCPDKIVLGLCATAARVIGHMTTHNLHAKVVAPLPYPLLYTSTAGAIRDAIMAIPQHARLHHLRIEITCVPPNVAAEQLAGLREVFRPAVREVAFLVNAFGGRSEIFNLDHIVIGADLSVARGWDEAELRTALARLHRDAAGRDTYVLGLRSHDHLKIAQSVDIDEIGGVALSADLEHLPVKLRQITPMALTTP